MPVRPPQQSSSQQDLPPIPEDLRLQLKQFQNQLWKIKIAEALLAGCFGLLFSFLLVFLLDRFFETPGLLRLVILLSGTSLIALFAPYWIRRWVFGHRRENQLARLISQHFPRLGDRLLGVVELQNQTDQSQNTSPELRQAAMNAVAKEASRLNLLDALPTPRHRKASFFVAGLIALTALAFFIAPNAGTNSLKRWLLPLSDIPRYTFTRLDLSHIPSPYHVPYGESFSLTVPLAPHSKNKPKTARARYGHGDWIQAPLHNNSYTFTFPGQRAMDDVTIEANDTRQHLRIEPILRPAMVNIHAKVKLPPYLQRKETIADLRSGYLTVLEESHVTIQAHINRKITHASAQLKKQLKTSTDTQPTPTQKKSPPQSLKIHINGNALTLSPISIHSTPLLIPIQWTGIYGLNSDSPLKIKIESIADQPPATYIQGTQRQHIILAEETIHFEVIAEDDYGIKSFGLSWQGEFTKPTGKKTATGTLTLAKGSPTATSLRKEFSFSPANLGIPPQKITLRSWTTDYKPGRKKIYSEPIIIYVLTRNEHAQVLKNQFDQIIGELEDIARKEQNLNDQNLRLDRKTGKELQKEKGKESLAKQEEAERKNKLHMQKLTEHMQNLFKNALRNGEIDKETLKKMQKALQSMQELSQTDLPNIEKQLQDSQNQRNTEKKTKQDLKKAIEAQKKALQKMKKALKDANDANRNFEASTFVNRLKRAASEEDAIASTFIYSIDKIIGLDFDTLDPVEQRSIKNAYNQQGQTAGDIRWIQEDLTHYFARTQKPEHKKLLQSMKDSKINESLENLTSKISANISYESISQAKYWAKQLRKWAKQLNDSTKSGGGGNGGGGSQEDKDFEFMLKVMRMIQKEQDIRARTRALEDLRRTLPLSPPQKSPLKTPS